MIAGAAIFILITVVPIALFAPTELLDFGYGLFIVASPFGPVIGAYAIWRIVRWVNRRDDPRYAKLPPNAP